ncbi:MAG: RNA methyltransferase [Eubacteriales bacterium]|nr:RNA methyltransferase [Eubacteriales bacterium]MDD4475635.1 RNA methyltransferase [Eubacteriales bacterium]
MLPYERIMSRNNDRIKRLVKLGDKKTRDAEGLFLIEGFKLAKEYLAKVGPPEEVYVREDAVEEFSSLISSFPSFDKKITCVSTEVYDKISDEKSPQGLLFVCRFLENIHQYNPSDVSGGIMLESVRDAGNLGTIIRSAASLGVEKIFLSADCADIYNRKTLRAAMGAVFGADIIICKTLAETALDIKSSGGRVFAAMPRGDALVLGEFSFAHNDCVVIGNEGEGISESLASVCDALTIPMAKGAESLNAAAAAAIIIWEMRKL